MDRVLLSLVAAAVLSVGCPVYSSDAWVAKEARVIKALNNMELETALDAVSRMVEGVCDSADRPCSTAELRYLKLISDSWKLRVKVYGLRQQMGAGEALARVDSELDTRLKTARNLRGLHAQLGRTLEDAFSPELLLLGVRIEFARDAGLHDVFAVATAAYFDACPDYDTWSRCGSVLEHELLPMICEAKVASQFVDSLSRLADVDLARWRTAGYVDRQRMAWSLVESSVLYARTTDEVHEILGPPDRIAGLEEHYFLSNDEQRNSRPIEVDRPIEILLPRQLLVVFGGCGGGKLRVRRVLLDFGGGERR